MHERGNPHRCTGLHTTQCHAWLIGHTLFSIYALPCRLLVAFELWCCCREAGFSVFARPHAHETGVLDHTADTNIPPKYDKPLRSSDFSRATPCHGAVVSSPAKSLDFLKPGRGLAQHPSHEAKCGKIPIVCFLTGRIARAFP